jgi:hypothetical protein
VYGRRRACIRAIGAAMAVAARARRMVYLIFLELAKELFCGVDEEVRERMDFGKDGDRIPRSRWYAFIYHSTTKHLHP